MMGLQNGLKSSLVLARKPSMSAGRYCIRLSRVLTRTVSWARLRLARLARDRFRCDHNLLDWVELVRIRWEPVDGQPVPGRDQFGHRGADVRIQVVSHEHQRAGELLVGGV